MDSARLAREVAVSAAKAFPGCGGDSLKSKSESVRTRSVRSVRSGASASLYSEVVQSVEQDDAHSQFNSADFISESKSLSERNNINIKRKMVLLHLPP